MAYCAIVLRQAAKRYGEQSIAFREHGMEMDADFYEALAEESHACAVLVLEELRSQMPKKKYRRRYVDSYARRYF